MMSSRSMVDMGIASPHSAVFTASTSPTVSILKRPTPLPLPPTSVSYPFATNLTLLVSPMMLSPHLHVPSQSRTPSTKDDLVFVSGSYSPLETPRGVKANSSKRVPVDVLVTSSFSDDSDSATSALPSKSEPLLTEELERVLSSLPYPVTPYPRSPFTPLPLSPAQDKENDAGREMDSRESKRSKDLRTPPPRVPRSQRKTGPRDILQLSPPRHQSASPPFQSETISTLAAKRPRAVSFTKPMPLDLEPDSAPGEGGLSSRLNSAFWKSVTLNGLPEHEDALPSCTSVTAVEQGASEYSTPISAVPPFAFGRKDMTIWSPGPRKQGPVKVEPETFFSPKRRVSFAKPAKSMVASPSPHDPFAAFPSFSAALTAKEPSVYPSLVIA